MNAQELQTLVREKIAAADFMQITIAKLESDFIEISAPLAPNSNVHGTLFAGSATSIGMVAAWCLVFHRMQQTNLGSNLVVVRQATNYLRPVSGDFTASARFAGNTAWQDFTDRLNKKGRGRIALVVDIKQGDEIGARIEAEYAASISSENNQS